MNPPALSTGSGVATAAAVIASASLLRAEPIDFPGTRYEQNFDDLLGVEWIYEGWTEGFVPLEGVFEMNTIRASSSGLDDFAFGGAEFPLEPLVPVSMYSDFGFDEGWLVNAGVGPAVETDGMGNELVGSGVWELLNPGIATVEFQNVPAHESISIGFLFASGGSPDYWDGANENFDGPFEIRVDGETVLSNNPKDFSGFLGIGQQPLVQDGNIFGAYQEEWNDNGGAGPTGPDDRFSIGWTLDNAYDFTAIPALTNIEHTADTLTVDFIHRLSSAAGDEHVAIENLFIQLNTGDTGPDLAWPGGASYSEDFEDLPANWIQGGGWAITAVPASGVAQVTGTGGNAGQVREAGGGIEDPDNPGTNLPPSDETAFLAASFPLDSIVPAESLSGLDPGFSGQWLTSAGSATHNGTISLSFTDLPEHSGIDLDFVLFAGDSFDADDIIDPLLDPLVHEWALTDPNFRIVVDGVPVYEDRITATNAPNAFFYDLDFVPLVTAANLNPAYREEWASFPIDQDNRSAIGWNLDAAYDFRTLFDEGKDLAIAHVADTITIDFIHGLNSGAADESIALDDFKLTLLGADGGGGPGVPDDFMIVTWERDPVVPTLITVTWNSVEGGTYDLERTVDFETWETVATGIAGLADKTAASDTAAPSGATGPFYRVRQTNAGL